MTTAEQCYAAAMHKMAQTCSKVYRYKYIEWVRDNLLPQKAGKGTIHHSLEPR
jgi:hypothetical protein